MDTVQPDLLPEIRDAIASERVEFGLRLLVLQALKRSPLIEELQTELVGLLLSQANAFANRSQAGDRLVEAGLALDWSALFEALLDQRTDDSVRLVSELMNDIGYHRFSDALVFEMVRAQFDRTERTVGVFMSLERDLPDERLDALLTAIAELAYAVGRPYERPQNYVMSDLMYGLLARRLTLQPPDVADLWSWLKPFEERSGYQRESRDAVARLFAANDSLRRNLQRYVLLDLPEERPVRQRHWRMVERSASLNPNEEDVRALLATMAEGDGRWRDVVTIARHGPDDGEAVRAAAVRFAAGDTEATAWLAGLAEHVVPEWQIKEEKRVHKRQAERDAAWAEHRLEFMGHIEEMRRGDYGYVINPANAYLKLFQDMGDDEADGYGTA